MFVGHATAAFAVVALAAVAFGCRRERALALGVAGAAFATVPDVDMVYALFGVLQADMTGAFALTETFWAASTAIHRSITHSVAVALPAAVAFALVGNNGLHRYSAISAAVLVGLVGVAAAVSGVLGAAVMAVFAVAGLVVGAVAARHGIGLRERFAVAFVGLATHPFGDVFTGEPPQLFYPLSYAAFDGRLAVSPDPTLNLLWAFAFELLAIWIGVVAYARLRGVRIQDHINSRAVVGAAYALAAFVIPPPTLSTSYHFVFSVLAVGFVGAVPQRRRLPDGLTAAVTGLTAVTVAGVAYALAYLAGTPAVSALL